MEERREWKGKYKEMEEERKMEGEGRKEGRNGGG